MFEDTDIESWPDWKKLLVAGGLIFGLLLVAVGLNGLAGFLMDREAWGWVLLGFFVWLLAVTYTVWLVWRLGKLAWTLLRDSWQKARRK